MSIRLEDVKERIFSIAKEFKGERMGMLGLGIIIFLVILAILAPFIAPGVDTDWADRARWEDNPRHAEPSWVDYILPGTRAPHVMFEDLPEPTDRNELIYEYDMEYDYPPSDITLRLHGESEHDQVILYIYLERPDGEIIHFVRGDDVDVSFEEGATVGTFERTFNLRSDGARDALYAWGQDFHEQYSDEEMPERAQVNIEGIAFAKANENILLDQETEKGQYNFTVRAARATSYDEDTTVIFRGRKFGLMGTDYRRADLALGWIWGARLALIIGGAVAIASISIATLYGMTSAYYGGWVDEFMQRVNEILLGIPMFPILIITMFIIGTSIWIFVTLYVLLGWRGLAKIIRSRGIQIRQDTYIEAAQALGSGSGRVITRHMVPQILPYAIAEGALMVPMVIIAEAGLAVLGLGDPNTVTWGRMLSEAHARGATTSGYWWWVIFPGIGITLVGFAFISTGMALERVINPKMRQR